MWPAVGCATIARLPCRSWLSTEYHKQPQVQSPSWIPPCWCSCASRVVVDVHRLLPRVLLRGVCSIFQFWLERIQAWIPPVTWTLRVLCAHPSSLVACVEDMGTVLSIAPRLVQERQSTQAVLASSCTCTFCASLRGDASRAVQGLMMLAVRNSESVQRSPEELSSAVHWTCAICPCKGLASVHNLPYEICHHAAGNGFRNPPQGVNTCFHGQPFQSTESSFCELGSHLGWCVEAFSVAQCKCCTSSD